MNLTDYSTIKRLLARHQFHFSRALGQNFLINPEICPKMVSASGVDKNSDVLEIGAGIGVLTVELAKTAKKVVTLEVDKRLLPVLAETLHDFRNVSVLNEDIMRISLSALFSENFSSEKVTVVANLPYYITSPVIMLLLESHLPLNNLTVMVQKEAAERICAEVGERKSGALTVAVRYYAEPELLFDVPRTCFLPSPNVDSAVIRLTLREIPPVEVEDEKFFFHIVQAAFAQRRKTAVNSLSAGLNLSKPAIAEALRQIGLSPNARAETFTLEQFAKLAEILGRIRNENFTF